MISENCDYDFALEWIDVETINYNPGAFNSNNHKEKAPSEWGSIDTPFFVESSRAACDQYTISYWIDSVANEPCFSPFIKLELTNN